MTTEADLWIFIFALFFAALGWLLLGVELIKRQALEESEGKAVLRAESLREELVAARRELGEVRELAEYRARILRQVPGAPVSARPLGTRVEDASYLRRPAPGREGSGS